MPKYSNYHKPLDISTTRSPLTINYNRLPSQSVSKDWYAIHVNHQQHDQASPKPTRRSRGTQKNRVSTSLRLGRRRTAKPLKIIKRRETPKGFITQVGNVALQAKEWVLKKKESLVKHKMNIDEGPISLRAITFTCGVAMCIASLVGLSFLHEILKSPAIYALQIYQLFFGLVTVVIEGKHLSGFEGVQKWMEEWFPFLSIPIGKGGAYIFMGILGGALLKDNLAIAIVGCFMILLGITYILAHFGLKKQLRNIGLELTQVGQPMATESNRQDYSNYHINNEKQNVFYQHYSSLRHPKIYSYRHEKFEYPPEYVEGINQLHREHLLNLPFNNHDQ